MMWYINSYLKRAEREKYEEANKQPAVQSVRVYP